MSASKRVKFSCLPFEFAAERSLVGIGAEKQIEKVTEREIRLIKLELDSISEFFRMIRMPCKHSDTFFISENFSHIPCIAARHDERKNFSRFVGASSWSSTPKVLL